MKDKILRLISSYNFQKKEGKIIETKIWTDIYTYDLLKSDYISKNRAAVEVHKLELQEEVLLFVQNGMSEKDSFIITEYFISIATSNFFSKNEQIKIKWDDIDSIKFINHSVVFSLKDGSTIDIDTNKLFSKNNSKAESLVQMLQRILKITRGEKEILVNSEGFLNKNRFILGGVLLVLIIGGIVLSQTFLNGTINKPLNDKGTSNLELTSEKEVPTVVYDTIWSNDLQEGFEVLLTYETVNIFYEPYEVTMQKQKWSSSRSADRIIIPIEIPDNTKYWIYRMKLSNARIESNEDKLVNDVSFKAKNIKIAGVNLKETIQVESSLMRDLLNSLNSPEKTKPFTNVYFIDSKDEAEKFQDYQTFKSDINNSIRKTHSRNGMMKFNKSQYVYLGLENDGYNDDIYVSLEVVALIEKKSYFKLEEK